jgi:hypothetical protein
MALERRLVDVSSALPLCGITDGQNITRCGMIVKGFLPLCGIILYLIDF